MSEVYIKEPTTKGAVVLHTTHGDLELELWASECPKACRNFCQLVLEGYYNDCIFHRVIKDFCIQSGDKSGTGDQSESVFGKPYPDEIHPRLKFRYRGMIGVASAGAGTKTNGSQFFIVLNRAPSLDRKHTLFAKVVGKTMYNLLRIADVEVDKFDRPVDPPRIIRAELTWDPFDDLEPRFTPQAPSRPLGQPEKHRREAIKNKKVLSFGGGSDEEDSDDEDEAPRFGKAKSAHDVLNDPKLAKQAAYDVETQKKSSAKANGGSASQAALKAKVLEAAKKSGASKSVVKASAAGGQQASKQQVKKKKADSESGSDSEESEDESSSEDNTTNKLSKTRNEQIAKLKRDIASLDKGEEPEPKVMKKMSELDKLRQGFKTRGEKQKPRSKEARKREAEEMIRHVKLFQGKVRDAMMNADDEEDGKYRDDMRRKFEPGTVAAIFDEGVEETSTDWLSGDGLQFRNSEDKAFRLDHFKARETLQIFDPLLDADEKEVLEMERQRRSAQMKPSIKRNTPAESWEYNSA
mmetsp:Transcript_57686/g.101007  ORF Transcript_57686/g.101007 Transcript_57686/m.101007 type:complete len:522 (-) Transcript_57686:34-1599(-)